MSLAAISRCHSLFGDLLAIPLAALMQLAVSVVTFGQRNTHIALREIASRLSGCVAAGPSKAFRWLKHRVSVE